MGGRIQQRHVAAYFPRTGQVRVLLVGEAPGPRGADRSGIPFWGDRAGKVVYRALVEAGMASIDDRAWGAWDGEQLTDLGLRPTLREAALSNAYPSCPTRDGETFCAPTDRQLRDPENRERLRREIARAQGRCSGALRVIAFGRRAALILGEMIVELRGASADGPIDLHTLPHPSAQGLLQAAPGKGAGLRLADLEAAWRARLLGLLNER